MTPERLNRIRAVYEAAVESPDTARGAVLERECKGDEALRQEVERLLVSRCTSFSASTRTDQFSASKPQG